MIIERSSSPLRFRPSSSSTTIGAEAGEAFGGPFRLGVALPVNVGASWTETSYGLFVRLILLTGRETEYGRTGKTAEP